jgi:hypothetical protein
MPSGEWFHEKSIFMILRALSKIVNEINDALDACQERFHENRRRCFCHCGTSSSEPPDSIDVTWPLEFSTSGHSGGVEVTDTASGSSSDWASRAFGSRWGFGEELGLIGERGAVKATAP